MDDSKDNSQVGALLAINNLDYRIPPALSVAVSRAHASYPSSSEITQPGKELIFVMPSGSQYIDFRNSYIKFTVTTESAATGAATVHSFNNAATSTFASDALPAGNPGALALFRSMRVVHSSGTVLDECNENLDALMFQRASWEMGGSGWKKSVGSLFDFSDSAGASRTDSANPAKQILPYHNFAGTYDNVNQPNRFQSIGTEHTYVIPLQLFTDLFSQEKLAPSFLVAGSRFHLTLNSAATAFITNDRAIPVTNYTISRASIHLEQFQLTDAIAKTLSAISASSGLEFPFVAWEHNASRSSNTRVSIQVTRALSRANNVMLLTRAQQYLNDPTKNCIVAQPMSSVEGDMKYQVQLGGQYIPTQPVQGSLESFQMGLVATRRYHTVTETDLNYWRDFLYRGCGVPWASLESSSSLEQSGAALSAQRVLLFNLERQGDNVVDEAGATLVNPMMYHVLFVSYVRLVTIFLDSVIVRS